MPREWNPKTKEALDLKELLEELGDKVHYNANTNDRLRTGLPWCGSRRPMILSSHAHERHFSLAGLGEDAVLAGGLEDDETDKQFKENANDNSIVMRFEEGHCSIVLPGDSSKQTEEYIRRYSHGDKPATILMAAHHGADTDEANSESWIEANQPKIGIVSAGYNSIYRHPRCTVMERFLKPVGDPPAPSPFFVDIDDFDNPSLCFPPGGGDPQMLPAARERALFNTLNMGTITAVFRKEKSGYKASEYVCLHAQTQAEPLIQGTQCSLKSTPSRVVVKKEPPRPRRRSHEGTRTLSLPVLDEDD